MKKMVWLAVLIFLPFLAHAQETSAAAAMGTLRIIGLDPLALLWIDDGFYPNPGVDTIELPLGVHRVYVWENGLQPLEGVPITVRDDNDSFVTWDRARGHEVASRAYGWSAAATGLVGVMLGVLGYFGGRNSVVLNLTGSYQEYYAMRIAAVASSGVAAALLMIAPVLTGASLNARILYTDQKRFRDSLEEGK